MASEYSDLTTTVPSLPPSPRADTVCPNQLSVGDRVLFPMSSKMVTGVLRFAGETDFKPGMNWAGIELDVKGSGKNDGSISGTRYFTCGPYCGIFVPLASVQRESVPVLVGGQQVASPVPKTLGLFLSQKVSQSIELMSTPTTSVPEKYAAYKRVSSPSTPERGSPKKIGTPKTSKNPLFCAPTPANSIQFSREAKTSPMKPSPRTPVASVLTPRLANLDPYSAEAFKQPSKPNKGTVNNYSVPNNNPRSPKLGGALKQPTSPLRPKLGPTPDEYPRLPNKVTTPQQTKSFDYSRRNIIKSGKPSSPSATRTSPPGPSTRLQPKKKLPSEPQLLVTNLSPALLLFREQDGSDEQGSGHNASDGQDYEHKGLEHADTPLNIDHLPIDRCTLREIDKTGIEIERYRRNITDLQKRMSEGGTHDPVLEAEYKSIVEALKAIGHSLIAEAEVAQNYMKPKEPEFNLENAISSLNIADEPAPVLEPVVTIELEDKKTAKSGKEVDSEDWEGKCDQMIKAIQRSNSELCDTLQQEVNELRASKMEMHETLELVKAQLFDVTSKLGKIKPDKQDRSAETTPSLETVNVEVVQLRATIQECRTQTAQYREAYEESQRKCKELEAETARKWEELEETMGSQRLEQMQAKTREACASEEQLRTQLRDAADKHAALQSSIEQAHQQYRVIESSIRKDYDATVEHVTSAWKTRYDALQQMTADAAKSVRSERQVQGGAGEERAGSACMESGVEGMKTAGRFEDGESGGPRGVRVELVDVVDVGCEEGEVSR